MIFKIQMSPQKLNRLTAYLTLNVILQPQQCDLLQRDPFILNTAIPSRFLTIYTGIVQLTHSSTVPANMAGETNTCRTYRTQTCININKNCLQTFLHMGTSLMIDFLKTSKRKLNITLKLKFKSKIKLKTIFFAKENGMKLVM